MSIRRFNYTERQRLNSQHVLIYLDEHGASRSFNVLFDFTSYGLPSSARVIVEAYRQTTVRRYAFGRVDNPEADGSTDLVDFGDSSGVLFRAKVVDASGSGRLLAAADRLHSADSKTVNRRSLIRVASAPLDGEIWRFSIDPGGPLLVIEQKFARESLLSSPHFVCLVYPQVFRDLLRHALDDLDDDGEPSWQSKAVSLGEKLSGKNAPEGDDTGEGGVREEWIDAVVTAFCKKKHLAGKYAEIVNEEGDEE